MFEPFSRRAAGGGSRNAGRLPDDGIRSYAEERESGAASRRSSGGGSGRAGVGACGPTPGSVKLPLRMLNLSIELLSLERSRDQPPGFLPVKIRSRSLSQFPGVGASCALCSDPLHSARCVTRIKKRAASRLRDCAFWYAVVLREDIVDKRSWNLLHTLLIEVAHKCKLFQVHRTPVHY